MFWLGTNVNKLAPAANVMCVCECVMWCGAQINLGLSVDMGAFNVGPACGDGLKIDTTYT